MILKVLFFYNIVVIGKFVAGNHINQALTNEMLPILKSPYVHMKNVSETLKKINKIICQGPENLQLITDFDKTVTKQHEDNTTTLDVFEIFYHCKKMPQSNVDKINAALSKYSAIDTNVTITLEQKTQSANDLYKTFHEMTRGIECDRKELETLICKYGGSLRERTNELFGKMRNLSVPVVVLSAGLSDVIEQLFDQAKIQYENNVFIIANSLNFNGTVVDGLKNHENLVHAYNKDELLRKTIHSEIFKNRKNVILMGDHLKDATVIGDFEAELTVLKIGFFYDKTEAEMELYKDAFDIVLDDDQTMNVILNILNLF